MLKCQVGIVNPTYENNNLCNVQYVPYCISTLKIQVINHENGIMNIRIYPINNFNTDDFCGGYDDHQKGIKVIWGGGIENGVKADLGPGQSKYLYLSLFHFENILSNYDLTLKVEKKIGQDLDYQEIKVRLIPIHNSINVMKAVGPDTNGEISFEGSTILNYYPRWFPESFTKMHSNLIQDNTRIPNIKIEIQNRGEKDRVTLKKDGLIIATVSGDMDGSDYHYEMYRLDNDLYIVRLWFFWLNRNNFKNKNNLSQLRSQNERGMFDWFSNPELPDFERIDLVIGVNNKVLFVGTDFHWQEYWYAIGGEIPQIDASITKYVFPIGETIERLILRVSGVILNTAHKSYEPIFTNLLNRSRATDLFMPNELLQNNVFDSKQIRHDEPVTRGQNLIRSHVPYVGTGKIVYEMITQDMTTAD